VNTPDIKKIVSAIESKKTGEKAILLGVLLLAIGYSWLLLVSDRIDESQAEINRRISVLSAQFVEETNRYSNIERNYRSDPNAFARNKRQELQQETIEVDERLRRLYGQLVQPRQMAQVLTTILQRETTLKLVGLENMPSAILTSAASGTVAPLVGGGEEGVDSSNGINVYRHGLRMTFEGDYLETIRYLRSLEGLETSFFWQSVNYEVVSWPISRISLDIFTLSTQEEWIGV